MTSPLVAELARSVEERISSLASTVSSLLGRLAAKEEATRAALGLFDSFVVAIREQVKEQLAAFAADNYDSTGDALRYLTFILRLVLRRSQDLEDWVVRGADSAVPTLLVDAVTRECESLLVEPRHVLLSVGDPSNLSTMTQEFPERLFSGLPIPPPTPERFALIRASRVEVSRSLYRPLILGHEVAHLACLERRADIDRFDLRSRLDTDRMSKLPGPRHLPIALDPEVAIQTAAGDWLVELVCDAYAIRRWGPSALTAMGSFFELIGDVSMPSTHPPVWLRLRLMRRWLGAIGTALEGLVAPWDEKESRRRPIDVDPWAEYLISVFEEAGDDILGIVSDWPGHYAWSDSIAAATSIADGFCSGLPIIDFSGEWVSDADLILGAWIARSRGCDPGQLDALLDKALEILDFVKEWHRVKGEMPSVSSSPPKKRVGRQSGVLTMNTIHARLRADSKHRLVINPLMPGAVGNGSIDLRLGRSFIVFQRAAIGSFNPLKRSLDPRLMQRRVERRWGEPFVLHPRELALAATLEYIALPGDLSAQVITRSSYGRVGLLTATAIQVHPLFRGCLTLELVNLGDLPIDLYPGARVAQLVLATTTELVEPAGTSDKYSLSTGPEFSLVTEDQDAERLLAMGDGGVAPESSE